MNQVDSVSRRRVVVLGTGGTISGRAGAATDNIGYAAGEVAVSQLLEGIAAPAGMSLLAEQVCQLDSKDMSFEAWQLLARRCAFWLADPELAGIVITHGTDTLEETAFFLHSVLGPSKPVVLTCAMRPASALSPDGPQNLRDAVAVAATPGAAGVVAVCAGRMHGAPDVQKVHTYRLDAFDSGDAGVLGHVEEGVLRRVRDWPALEVAPGLYERAMAAARWPRVEIVTSHAGASGAMIDAMLQQPREDAQDALQGLVIAATGNGTVHHALEAAALRAMADGVAVVRATRCVEGRILPRPDDRLRDAGALTPVKARIALLLELLD